jgi:hypothetical protein
MIRDQHVVLALGISIGERVICSACGRYSGIGIRLICLFFCDELVSRFLTHYEVT